MARNSRLVAFPYYGGKNSHLDWLLPLLPEGPSVKHYCEPFGGSAAVLLNRKPAPIETYNDLDGELCNFFKVLREQEEKLLRRLRLTLYSRDEFRLALQPSSDPLERARRYFVLLRMGMGGTSGFSEGNWARQVVNVRSGHSPLGWIRGVEGLRAVAERLRSCQIDNLEAAAFLESYDDKGTLFYCDPPYDPEVCSPDYKFNLDAEGYAKFIAAAEKCKGMVAVSGYDSPMLSKAFKHWHRTLAKSKIISVASSNKPRRQEILWTNYDPYPRRLFRA